MVAELQMTEEMNDIKNWAEKYQLKPGKLEDSSLSVRKSLVLYKENEKEGGVEELSWEELESILANRENDIAFVYADAEGETPYYYKFAPRDSFINQQESVSEDVDALDNASNEEIVE